MSRVPKVGEAHEFRPPTTLYCVDCGQAERHAVHGWRWDPEEDRWIEPAWWPPAEPLAVRDRPQGGADGETVRITEAELACRTGDDGRRFLAGITVPYGRRSDPVLVGGRRVLEMFRPGSARVDPRGIVLRSRHPDPQLRGADRVNTIIGRAVATEQRDEGLWAEFRMSRDAEAERLWGMADDGTLNGLSVEFSQSPDRGFACRELPAPSREELPLRIVTSAVVHGTALVDHPAYADAAVAITRASDPALTPAELGRWSRTADLRRRIEILERTSP